MRSRDLNCLTIQFTSSFMFKLYSLYTPIYTYYTPYIIIILPIQLLYPTYTPIYPYILIIPLYAYYTLIHINCHNLKMKGKKENTAEKRGRKSESMLSKRKDKDFDTRATLLKTLALLHLAPLKKNAQKPPSLLALSTMVYEGVKASFQPPILKANVSCVLDEPKLKRRSNSTLDDYFKDKFNNPPKDEQDAERKLRALRAIKRTQDIVCRNTSMTMSTNNLSRNNVSNQYAVQPISSTHCSIQHNLQHNIQHNLQHNIQHNLPNVQNNIPNVQHNVQNNIPNVQHNLQNNIPNVQHNVLNAQTNIRNKQPLASSNTNIIQLSPLKKEPNHHWVHSVSNLHEHIVDKIKARKTK